MDYRIRDGYVSIFSVPLKRPFITALGRKTETTNVGIHVRLRNGMTGYGEASGSVVMANLSPNNLAKTLKSELRRIMGRDIRHLIPMIQEVWTRRQKISPAAAAMECALTDALTRSLGISMREWFGGTTQELETDITLSAGSADEATEAATEVVREGFWQLKVKVGKDFSSDLRRVNAVWETASRECHLSHRSGLKLQLILDGNQGMGLRSALRLVEACLKRGIKIILFEQPLPRKAVGEMKRLKRRCPVPLAADESVRSVSEAVKILDMDAVDVINVKVAKTGLQSSLQIIALARAAKKKLMIGCMQETAAGLSAGVHLACGTGAFDFVDLDSDHLLVPTRSIGDFKRLGPRVFF